MAFSLDRTKSFVRIDESNLISIHRSTYPIVPAVEYSQGHLCDAFICAAREYNLFRVYICLYNTQLKSNLVFVTDPVGFDNNQTAILIKEAESFLTNIGFCMEQVNMEFSPATREVIMRDMRAMREPPIAIRLDAAMSAIEELTVEMKELIQKASRAQKTHKAEVDKLRQLLVLANAAPIESLVKPVLHEESVNALIVERESLRAELAAIREEIESLIIEQLPAQVNKKKTQADQKSFDTLLMAAKEETYDAQQEVLLLKEAIKVAQNETKTAKEDTLCLLEKIDIARNEAFTAKAEVQTTRLEIQALKEAARAVEEQAQADKNMFIADTLSLQQEIERLQREHDTIMAVQSNEIYVLKAALTIADENLIFERAKNESALQEMDALERNAAVELKKLKRKVDSFSDEKKLLESMAAEMKNKAKGEIEHLQQINQAQRRAAVKKVKTLKEEMRQLAEARAVMTSPLAVSFSSVDSRNPPNSLNVQETLSNHTESARSNINFSDPFGFSDKAEYVSFEPDSKLKSIPYATLEDVVEVYRSFNKIQAAPFGKHVQNCDGFVCLVKDQRLSMLVYVVWMMKETGEVLVCRPEQIPETGDIVMNMMREGIGYFERVGFIMDELIFMPDPEQRQQQIDSLTFFHKIVMECAA